VQEQLRRSGVEPVGGTPQEFAALIESETAKYAKLLKAVGMAGSAEL
jgi:tripartite-type tricarboxylate transporter receptor subunit TctC